MYTTTACIDWKPLEMCSAVHNSHIHTQCEWSRNINTRAQNPISTQRHFIFGDNVRNKTQPEPNPHEIQQRFSQRMSVRFVGASKTEHIVVECDAAFKITERNCVRNLTWIVCDLYGICYKQKSSTSKTIRHFHTQNTHTRILTACLSANYMYIFLFCWIQPNKKYILQLFISLAWSQITKEKRNALLNFIKSLGKRECPWKRMWKLNLKTVWCCQDGAFLRFYHR